MAASEQHVKAHFNTKLRGQTGNTACLEFQHLVDLSLCHRLHTFSYQPSITPIFPPGPVPTAPRFRGPGADTAGPILAQSNGPPSSSNPHPATTTLIHIRHHREDDIRSHIPCRIDAQSGHGRP